MTFITILMWWGILGLIGSLSWAALSIYVQRKFMFVDFLIALVLLSSGPLGVVSMICSSTKTVIQHFNKKREKSK